MNEQISIPAKVKVTRAVKPRQWSIPADSTTVQTTAQADAPSYKGPYSVLKTGATEKVVEQSQARLKHTAPLPWTRWSASSATTP